MTIADEIQALSDDRTAIQNAILAKGGTVTSADGFDDFASAIAAIPSGGIDISDTTAIAADVRVGKYFYTADGTKTQGTIATYNGEHHSAGYSVTISLTNPHDDYAFGSVEIYLLDYDNAQISTWAEDAIFLGSIESSTGSITVTVPIDAFERNCIKISIITQGMDYEIDSPTATGGVTYLFNYDGPTFEVAGNGTATLDGIWWDED